MTSAWRSFGELLPVVLAIAAIGVALLIVAWRGTPRTRRVAVLVMLALWALLFAAVTLKPNVAGISRSVDLIPFRDVTQELNGFGGTSQALAQIGGNLLMAAPVGVLFRIYWGPGGKVFRRTLLWSGFFFCVIEAMQFLLAIGRATTVDDVILGLTGCAIGWVGCQIICLTLAGTQPPMEQRTQIASSQK